MRIAEIEIEYKNGKGETVTQKPRLKLKEVPVKGIVNDKRQKVKFSVQKDGSLKWNDKATPDIIKIGNAMARTKTGLAQLRKLDEAKYPIMMVINVVGNTKLGHFAPQKMTGRYTGLTEILATLIVYEKGIDFIIGRMKKNSYSYPRNDRDILQDYFAHLGKKEELIGAIAGHEAEHSTLVNLNMKQEWDAKVEADTTLNKTPYKELPFEQDSFNIEYIILKEEYAKLSADELLQLEKYEEEVKKDMKKNNLQ